MKSRTWLVAVPMAAALAVGVAACGGSSGGATAAPEGGAGGTINGAGSTLAQPIYQQWASNLKSKGITLNYQGVGSGAGVAAFAAGTADFAASDPALLPSDKRTIKKSPPIQIPTVLGAITVAYNVPGVGKGLKLDGPTIADIFLGKVKEWNNPEIANQNPGLKLPSTAITVVHRSDESGTTKGFTTFLADWSPQWKSQVGTDKTVKWPTGTGAAKNSGVAAAVKQTQGAVGYVEEAYALQNNFTSAEVKNRSSRYVGASLQATSAAGQNIAVPADLGFSAINSPNPSAYPIVSQTFIDVHRDVCEGGMAKANAEALKAFLEYALGPGQSVARQIYYAPLPAPLLAKAKAQLGKLQCNGSAL